MRSPLVQPASPASVPGRMLSREELRSKSAMMCQTLPVSPIPAVLSPCLGSMEGVTGQSRACTRIVWC